VSSEKRYELVQFVYKHNLGIKEASVRVNINYQTAKSIIRRFRQTGKIERINKIASANADRVKSSVGQGSPNSSSIVKGLKSPQEDAEIDRENRRTLSKKEETCFELMQEQHREILTKKKRAAKAQGKKLPKV
jgi:hypothetical protein